jgi:hypothetical protein
MRTSPGCDNLTWLSAKTEEPRRSRWFASHLAVRIPEPFQLAYNSSSAVWRAVLRVHLLLSVYTPLPPFLCDLLMAPGVVAGATGTAGYAHLIDPNRKWYNDRR